MKQRLASCAAWMMMAALASGQTPAQSQPAPPPGSPGLFKSAAELADVLRQATPTPAGMTTSPVALTDQYRINIVHRTKAAGALAHPGNTELHYIVDGTATVVTGGHIVKDAGGARIEGGVTRRVGKGDTIVIPADSAHWYSAVDGTVTYLEVRWLAPAK